MKKILLGLGIGSLLALAACGGDSKDEKTDNPVSCTNPEATQYILDSVAKKAKQTTLSFGGHEWAITEPMVQAIWAQLQLKVDNIRTDSQTDSKVTCLASYAVDVPANVYKQAEEGYVAWQETDADLTSGLTERGWRKEGSGLLKSIQYTVQQTDDGKKIITELDQPSEVTDGLAYVVTGYIVRDLYNEMLEAEAEYARERDAQDAKLQALDDERVLAGVNEAKELNKFAHQRLNAVWNGLPEDVRNELKGVQKAWNEKRTTECRYSASVNADRTPEQSLIMVQCDTGMVEERTRSLEVMANRHASSELTGAETQLSGLKIQMQQTWSTFPTEVKEALQTEQQDWQKDTQTICTSKRSQTENQEASKLLYTQCMVEETKKRIAALKKYQV